MSKANVDPAELRRFAQDLNRFNNELQGLLSGLHGKLRSLEATWRDQEQRKFSEAFEGTVLRMLAKRADERHQTAADLLSDLERVATFQGVVV